MYVILTSKPGQFRTDPGGLATVEAYDYVFHGRKRAHFVIARLEQETRVRIVEEGDEGVVNLVPSKFLPHFETVEAARAELDQLSRFGNTRAELVRV